MKNIQNLVVGSILRGEKNATLEIFKSLKIVRFVNRFDKPCFRVYFGNEINPIAASFFRDNEEMEKRVKQLKIQFSQTFLFPFNFSEALIWSDKLRGFIAKLPDGFTTTSNNLDNLVFLLNDYSNLL